MAKGNASKLGKWNKTENQRFMKALQKYGKNWALIQKAVGTRSLAQVRSHAQKLFLSMSKSDLKTLELELAQRFQSFCNVQKSNVTKNSKKVSAPAPAIQNFCEKCLVSLEDNCSKKSEMKETESNWSEIKDKNLNQESTQKDNSSELSMGEEEQNQNVLFNNPYMFNMGYCQAPEMGFFMFPQPAMVWMPY